MGPKIGDRVETIDWLENDPEETLIPGVTGTVSAFIGGYIWITLDKREEPDDYETVKPEDFDTFYRLIEHTD